MTTPRSRPSIRARLALLYTALLAAALVAFGSGVFLVLRSQLTASFDASLRASAEHAADALSQDVPAGGILQPNPRLIAQFASTGGRIVILDARGDPVADSAPSASPLPVGEADVRAADAHAHAVREVTVDGDTLRLTVEPLPGPGGAPAGYVVWADSTGAIRDVLDAVVASLFIGGLVIVVAALGAGLVLARRALAPVADVTETARAISLSGDFAGRVEVGRTNDEVGELAVAFNEMLAALEANHQTLQRFLGHASHELRSPLTTIRANLDLARRPGLTDAERREILLDASDEAERMGRLVSDLLALARADAGQRLESRPVELDAVLIEAVRHHRQTAPDIHMAVISVEPATVLGDRDRLRELVGIVLDNAARYTPSGGAVTGTLEVRSAVATIRIEDTGIGIDPGERDRVFERLYRGARAREMRPAGTGLGLAIARWIAAEHAGTIELSDRDGGGTVATIRLPVMPG